MKESFWDFFDTWESAEKVWDLRAKRAAEECPLDIPVKSPIIPQIAPDEARFLRLKALLWVLRHDKRNELLRFFSRNILGNVWRYGRSFLRKDPFVREGDFFCYGMQSKKDFYKHMQDENTLLVTGFSYCEKPKECPSGRFSNQCMADEDHNVCRQCFIGKVRHALPRERTLFTIVPTINAIGEEISRAITAHKNKKILFLIASCEMALTMFGDLGNMAGIQGLGVKLSGRICNTMQAFALSEKGLKPGMTWLHKETEGQVLELIRFWREQ